MLQDVEAGRRTEIDVINGAVVRAADEVGVAVPINRALMQLIKGWETQRGLAVSTRLTYHGAASYEIVSPTHTILIDPFLSAIRSHPVGRTTSARPM